VGDVVGFDGFYDLAVAADVLVYLGDLAEVMNKVSKSLRPQGIFAFTVEQTREPVDWILGPKSRYAHSESYIRRVVEDAGLELKTLAAMSSRLEAGEAVPGLLVVAQHE
jgi:predicted TPR repeat methyltransferase